MIFVKYRKVYQQSGTLFSEMRQGIGQSFYIYHEVAYKDLFDEIQQKYKCCAVNGPNDWEPIWRNKSAPAACCKNMQQSRCAISEAFQKGCLDSLFDEQLLHGLIFGFIHVVLVVCEIITAALSFYLVVLIEQI
ncbi:tetraspanin-9-like [Agrilus planipennis]|uniref:Tetraspanin-9-like n=1 Tax=Agrilus planipennis TaxID=224129 RepID=A0A1W4X103_AGRPL|nr:tetraspanin-9-like [Agrilus planipennis]